MARRTVVCPECDEPVPYGRLSCPSCGALLASVAGGPRRVAPLPGSTVEEPPLLRTDDDEPPQWTPPLDAAVTAEADDGTPEAPPPADEVEPVLAPADVDDASEPAPPEVELPASEPPAPDPYGAGPASVGAAIEDQPPPPASTPAPAPGSTAGPAPTAPPALADWPPAPAWPPPPPDWAAPRPPAGAASTGSFGSSAAAAAIPAMPAGSWLPPSAAIGPDDLAPERPSRRFRPGAAPLLADLPFDAPDDLPGWIATIGGVMGVAGFLLPWAPIVIGARSTGGYTDSWGFATPTHLLAFALVALTLSVTFVPNRLPVWLRTGVLGLVVGGLLIGLAWPYLLVLPDAEVGVMTLAVGGVLLVIGGLLAVRPGRHESGEPGV